MINDLPIFSMNQTSSPIPDSEILLYTSPDGQVQLDVRLQEDTLWMTQQMMAELFQTTVQNIIMHVGIYTKNLSFNERELVRISYKFEKKARETCGVRSISTTWT